MRFGIGFSSTLLLIVAAVSPVFAVAQSSPVSGGSHPAEVAFDYTYLRSNAPPGGCGCINMNGGSASFAWMPGRFGLVGDVTFDTGSNISTSHYGLTLTAFTAGARYAPRFRHSAIQPFGQVLAGVAHSSGSLTQIPADTNASAAFAANVGGGIDWRISRHVGFRAIEAEYLVTTFDNGVNDHQNNLRISTGLVLHF